jgi:hypothetical protein
MKLWILLNKLFLKWYTNNIENKKDKNDLTCCFKSPYYCLLLVLLEKLLLDHMYFKMINIMLFIYKFILLLNK